MTQFVNTEHSSCTYVKILNFLSVVRECVIFFLLVQLVTNYCKLTSDTSPNLCFPLECTTSLDWTHCFSNCCMNFSPTFRTEALESLCEHEPLYICLFPTYPRREFLSYYIMSVVNSMNPYFFIFEFG